MSTKDVCTEEKWNMNYPSFTKTSISEYYRTNVETRVRNFLHINWTHELPYVFRSTTDSGVNGLLITVSHPPVHN